MNLNQILPGTDYAWLPNRGRGEEFRWPSEYWPDDYMRGVHRVKAIRTFSERLPGNKRETGYVEVFILDEEGEFRYEKDINGNDTEEYLTRKARVRDIATFWEEYEDERDHRTVLRDKERQEREARRLEQERIWREQAEARERERQERLEAERIERERVEQERQAYLLKIEKHYSLPTGSVQYENTYSPNLVLKRDVIDADLTNEETKLKQIDTTKDGWLSDARSTLN
jgi:hypothetical protein